ncbi:MAG: LacI family transcriptional regulator [Treponema sp.]|jgi:LacI family transcriptional regulator|nr:LacI family transcriptional regulator [Treponema sp.]
MKKNSGINIKKIAQLTGVDPSTVSRALNGSRLVKSETRERIEKTAKENGYIRDSLAKSLIVGKTNTLGILVPEISSTFYSRIVHEIEDMVGKNNYGIILAATNYSYLNEKKGLNEMLSKRVDALVFCTASEQILQDYRDLRAPSPLVLCDTIWEDIPYDNVYVDEKTGILKAVQYLVKIGHREISFIAEQNLTLRRLDIFARVMHECGQRLNKTFLLSEPSLDSECGYAGMKRLLKVRQRPTAIICARDTIAIGAMRAASESGVRIPGDMSIIGYDDINVAKYLYPALTTIRQPSDEIGRNVGEIVLHRLRAKTRVDSFFKVTIIPELVIRESAGPPKKNSKYRTHGIC